MKRSFYIHCRNNGQVVLETVTGTVEGWIGYHKNASGKWVATDIPSGCGILFRDKLKDAKADAESPETQERLDKIKKEEAYQKTVEQFKRLMEGQDRRQTAI